MFYSFLEKNSQNLKLQKANTYLDFQVEILFSDKELISHEIKYLWFHTTKALRMLECGSV